MVRSQTPRHPIPSPPLTPQPAEQPPSGQSALRHLSPQPRSPTPCAGITCEGCNRVWPGEHFPFALCNFCRASPSWHHGRCCRSRQAQQARTGQQLRQAQVHAAAVGAAGSADHSAAGAHVSAGAAADASSQAAASLWTSAGDETANASADFEGDEMASASSVCAGIGDHPTLSGPAANFAATQKQGTLLRGDGLSLRLRGVRGQRPC
jgi:hypothetical protein